MRRDGPANISRDTPGITVTQYNYLKHKNNNYFILIKIRTNWKRISGILCDRRISLRVKGKVYNTLVRPAIMYGADTWAQKKVQEKLDVAEDG